MKYARVIDQTVVEVFTPPDGLTINECFTPQVVALFEPVDAAVDVDWIKNQDDTFSPPAP